MPNNTLYTSQVDPGLLNVVLALLVGSTPIYYASPNVTLTDPATCYWTAATGTVACKVCPGSYTNVAGLLTGCSVSFVDGLQATYVMDCDIDDHAWAWVLGASALGVYLIRRKGLF
ncbi:hypothetical protein VRU48_01670 [Pedobacter sp. KR3-3]|uniref:Uncharacterized protein n=1 Tax=Pedobacter albus TaxID=3113905 RepID=A0ABU7I2W0_9SPHI|nr:hypothetical protein [Pedobacter sp. KR3-3]MEE1943795.1 hypothetical protein [Pedobacter sp. KR3-3]